jgi:hypothetical protein
VFFESSIPHLEQYLNIFGLILDIIGAWLVAYEVVSQYKGSQFKTSNSIVFGLTAVNNAPEETLEYQKWLNKRNRYMWFGLTFLTLGFLVQIVANLII